MRKVLLIDGSNLARRNFHGQSLCTTGGIKTGAIYGTINSMISVQGDIRANEVVVAWDMKGSSQWRKDIYPLYKANRDTPDPDYVAQRQHTEELLNHMGVCQVSKEDAEADDLIGALAKHNYADYKVYILSGDHDFYSLIEDGIHVISPISGLIAPNPEGKIYVKNGAKVIELYPHQISDYKSLVGDSSDNIPGAPGFGIGAAITFFKHNDSIDGLFDGTANLKGLTNRAIEGIMISRPFLKKFKECVTISLERGKIPTPTRPEKNERMVDALFKYFEFNQFIVRGERVFDIAGVEK